MTRTREQYLCVCVADRVCGLQAETDEQIVGDVDELRTMLETCAGRDDFEAKLRARWPGRAYWIEVGDDATWVQVVEYGAFANKPHKQVEAENDLDDVVRVLGGIADDVSALVNRR